jgi:hypothetical protein
MAHDPTTQPIIALDTNALVQSIPTRGRFRPMIEGFDAGRFLLVVSNEILLEYEEILKAIGGQTAWSAFESLLIAAPPSSGESIRRISGKRSCTILTMTSSSTRPWPGTPIGS